ncbi:MAG: type I DNA topoisomerase [Bacteroidales bacterium]|nr:type I DNA topoisomerase [Bacteroidales bacterium]
MAGKLVIVESPHKAKQIQGYLGEGYTVRASQGHVRDLAEKDLSIDTSDGFAPRYVISAGKEKIIAELKSLATKSDTVLLASDPDREGEAIAWHLKEVLGLDDTKARRVSYNEVTKSAIEAALANPREIDMDLVKAQTARRVLDRLVGFELSPVLWRKVKRGLSAGRVQSVALRLVVDREREIAAFVPEPSYRVEALFDVDGSTVKGTLNTRFSTLEEARRFLEDSIGATYTVDTVESREGTRNPAPPFTTSTLQQEAARKIHLPVSTTMRVAQALYERGLITYMRTDSTNLSSLALATAKKYICDNYGGEYSNPRQYKTKSKGAQEAHEAIRPTFIGNCTIEGTPQEQKLYNLIWKRTVASQMAEARVLNTGVRVASDKRSESYSIQAAEILFDGFLKLYMESVDDEEDIEEVSLPAVKPGQRLGCGEVRAECKYTQPPYRYSQASLVKKLEELEIGRPSTYATIIDTLTKVRGYVVQGDKEGRKVEVQNLRLEGGTVRTETKTELIGAEKGKLIPQDLGMIVSDYLVANFEDIMDYDFTARVEKDFDKIAEGSLVWNELIGRFYSPFHRRVDETMKDGQYSRVSRDLGIDPADGKPVVARFGQFGPYVQKGEGDDKVCASLAKGQLIETITLEEALRLFQLPRVVGNHDGVDIVARKGRFGPYIQFGGRNFTLPKGADPVRISLDECVRVIAEADAKPAVQAPIAEFKDSDISVINGRFGPYIKHAGSNYKIPKGTDASTLTEEACKAIIADTAPSARKFRKFKKK